MWTERKETSIQVFIALWCWRVHKKWVKKRISSSTSWDKRICTAWSTRTCFPISVNPLLDLKNFTFLLLNDRHLFFFLLPCLVQVKLKWSLNFGCETVSTRQAFSVQCKCTAGENKGRAVIGPPDTTTRHHFWRQLIFHPEIGSGEKPFKRRVLSKEHCAFFTLRKWHKLITWHLCHSVV